MLIYNNQYIQVAHEEIDIHDPIGNYLLYNRLGNVMNPGFTPEERESFDK
jgi:hypothetical protein